MKLAIIIEGSNNSGKTSTIKHLVNNYSNRSLNRIKAGWQRIFLNPNFPNLKIDVYCIPSSPSESDNPLSNRFSQWLPDVILVAEQPNGKHYNSTYTFLQSNGFQIITRSINNIDGSGDWERFDVNSSKLKLDNRAEDIINDTIQLLKTNKII